MEICSGPVGLKLGRRFEGAKGRVFEMAEHGEIVWEYICPFFAPYERRGLGNSLFRAYRYFPDSPEIAGRLKSPAAW